LQPGAPAEFQVLARDLNGQPADAEIVAKLTDEARPAALATVTGRAERRAAGEGKAPGEAQPGSAPAGTAAGQALAVSPAGPAVSRVRTPPRGRLRPGASLGMQVSASKKGGAPGRQPVQLRGRVQLTSPVYLTHLTTDKPMYQPGEVVRFRSLTLDRLTLAP